MVDGLVTELLGQRQAPGPARTSPPPTPSATPSPAWASRPPTPRPAGPEAPTSPEGVARCGNGQRKGAIRRKGKGTRPGRGAASAAGWSRGPTPKAEEGHTTPPIGPQAVTHTTQRPRSGPPPCTARPGSGPEWVAGRNAVLEAMEAGIPTKTAYVAEGAERDDRLRDIFKLAAGKGTPLLEVTRVELDRLTGGAVHQGVAYPELPTFEYAHPDDLLAAALDAPGVPLVVALDSITDPVPGCGGPSAAAFGAQGVLDPERWSAGITAAAWKTSAGAAARIPIARATNLNRACARTPTPGSASSGSTGRRHRHLRGGGAFRSAGADRRQRGCRCPGWSARPVRCWPRSRSRRRSSR